MNNSLSRMRVTNEQERISTLPEDQIQSLFRYVANLEDRVHNLERKQHAYAYLIQKIFRKFNMFRRRVDGFSPLKNKFIKLNDEQKKDYEKTKRQLEEWRSKHPNPLNLPV